MSQTIVIDQLRNNGSVVRRTPRLRKRACKRAAVTKQKKPRMGASHRRTLLYAIKRFRARARAKLSAWLANQFDQR